VEYTTVLRQFGNNTGIEVPAEVLESLGAGKRPPVVVTVGDFTYRSTVGVMNGLSLIPFSSDKRAATGLRGGEEIVVSVELDSAPRTVEVPADLAEALAAADARAAFDALSPSAAKAHVTNVEGAKTPETRERRIAAVVAKLAG
jgi:hypothetical protein